MNQNNMLYNKSERLLMAHSCWFKKLLGIPFKYSFLIRNLISYFKHLTEGIKTNHVYYCRCYHRCRNLFKKRWNEGI